VVEIGPTVFLKNARSEFWSDLSDVLLLDVYFSISYLGWYWLNCEESCPFDWYDVTAEYDSWWGDGIRSLYIIFYKSNINNGSSLIFCILDLNNLVYWFQFFIL
jgi:hypothetical protein